MIAKVVKRMTERQKEIASFEAEMFGIEIGYAFMTLSRDSNYGEYSAQFLNGFEDNSEDAETAAEIVRCPHCKSIQVCYGQYGDPETEICICTQCKQSYKTEPF
jgi:DNA-directed RNA polymerase subunit M/transcription elongation factor TFIIS